MSSDYLVVVSTSVVTAKAPVVTTGPPAVLFGKCQIIGVAVIREQKSATIRKPALFAWKLFPNHNEMPAII